MANENLGVKKRIKYKDLTIVLDDIALGKSGNERTSNIQAFDQKDSLIWTADKPLFNLHYFDMQIDEKNNFLEADSGAGRIYIIDLNNGHIIKSYLVK